MVLYTLFFLIVRVFIWLNKCILGALLCSMERSFKRWGPTSGRVLGQASTLSIFGVFWHPPPSNNFNKIIFRLFSEDLKNQISSLLIVFWFYPKWFPKSIAALNAISTRHKLLTLHWKYIIWQSWNRVNLIADLNWNHLVRLLSARLKYAWLTFQDAQYSNVPLSIEILPNSIWNLLTIHLLRM